MGNKFYSGLKRSMAWMLTAAMMAQGCVVYADDFTSEPEAADVFESVSESDVTSTDSDLEYAEDGEDVSIEEETPDISEDDTDSAVIADEQQSSDDSSEESMFSDGTENLIVSDGAESVGDTTVKPPEKGDIEISGDEKYSYARFRDANNYYRYSVAVYPANNAELTMNLGDTRAVDHKIMYNTQKYAVLSSLRERNWSCGKNKAESTYGNSSVGYSAGNWEITEETPAGESEHVVEIVKNTKIGRASCRERV